MSNLSRRWIAIGAVLAAIGVGLGAFGSHVLKDTLTHLGYSGDDLIRRTAIWETAVRYQLFHSIALVVTGLALQHRDTRAWRFAAWAFLVGIVLFSGSLKALSFTGPQFNRLGAITPFGGLSMIAGWLAIAVGAIRRS